MKLKLKSKLILGVLPVLMGLTFARATPDELPCAVVMKTGKAIQVIPPKGSVQMHLKEGVSLACGSMVITQSEAFWLRLSDQTVVKISPFAFVEIPKMSSHVYHLYRGSALISAPPGIYTQTWTTPNAESIFKGGVAFIQYTTAEKLTTVGCFNRNFEFKNKFNPRANQVVHAGETSHLMIQDAQVTPTQPAVMSHTSVVEALAGLALPEADQAELVKIVKQVYEDRSKSLASEIEQWEEVPETLKPARSIASLKGAKSVPAVDPKEADFVTAQLRAHLYGDEEDQKSLNGQRKPASSGNMPLKDLEEAKRKKNLKLEMKKLETEIGHLDSN